MRGRSPGVLVGAVICCALVCGALGAPSSALPVPSRSTKEPRTLVMEPAAPLVGERPRVSGRAPAPAGRLVKLQVRRSDGTWRTIDRRRTRGNRAFGFRLAPVRQAPSTLRVLAPSVERTGSWRSARLEVRGAWQQVDLTVPTEARAGERVVTTAVVSPARPGREVALLVGHQVVAVGVQDELGRAVLTLAAPPPGLATVSAIVPGARGAGSVTSQPVVLRTLPAVTGIPRVDLVTDDGQPVTSKETYKRATLTVDPRGSGVPGFSDSVRVRVRGNFTSTIAAKRPYRVKLDDNAALAGLPDDKDWVLLANYFDRTLLRTTLGMEIGRRMGLPWSPRMVDAEVWLNGELKGLYQLGEAVEVDEDRVDIELAAEDATDAGMGGFLLEADSHDETDPRFTTARGLRVYVKEPEDALDPFVNGVAAQVQAFEDVLYSPSFADPQTGYATRIDVDSFVDWYLTMELFKQVDAGFMNSVYLTRTTGGRLSMGPPWDFDLGAGNRVRWEGTSASGWFVRRNWFGSPDGVPSQMTGAEGHWWVRMFEDPAFEAAVRTRWSQVRAGLLDLPAFVQARRGLIDEAALRNFTPTADGGAGFVTVATEADPEHEFRHWATWDESTDALVSWLTARLAWMDGQLS